MQQSPAISADAPAAPVNFARHHESLIHGNRTAIESVPAQSLPSSAPKVDSRAECEFVASARKCSMPAANLATGTSHPVGRLKVLPGFPCAGRSLRFVHDIAARLISVLLRPLQWADVRTAVILSALCLTACAVAMLPSFWPHGLDGACIGSMGFGWNGADEASLRHLLAPHEAQLRRTHWQAAMAQHHDATHATARTACNLPGSGGIEAAMMTHHGTTVAKVIDVVARMRLPDSKPHLALAMLGLGILIAISGVRGATRPGTLHVRAFKVQAVVLGEVVICHALMATGWTAPVCSISDFLSGDATAIGGRQSTGDGACISCAQRFMLRYAGWWAGQVAFLGLVAHILRMRRALAATVLACITVNLVTGVAMALHALRGMRWVFVHAALIIYVAGLYTAHSWAAWRASCCSKPHCGLQRIAARRHRDGQSAAEASGGDDEAAAEDGGNAAIAAAAGVDDPCMQKVSPRLAAFAGACVVFVLAVRFAAGAVQLRVPCAWKPIFEACEDAIMYLLAPLAIISGEVLSDARMLTQRLAAAEARARAKRDILRFFSHEVRVYRCCCCGAHTRVRASSCNLLASSTRRVVSSWFSFRCLSCVFHLQLRVPLNGIVVGLELLAGLDRDSTARGSLPTTGTHRDDHLAGGTRSAGGVTSPAPGTGGSGATSTVSAAASTWSGAAAESASAHVQPTGRRAVVQEMQGAAASIKSLVSDFLALESARVSGAAAAESIGTSKACCATLACQVPSQSGTTDAAQLSLSLPTHTATIDS